MPTDKELYQLIADEMAEKNVDAALWAQAMGMGEGDDARTQAAYIRLRFADLKKAAMRAPAPASTAGARRPESDILTLRTELRKKLQEQQKMSLYSVLGVQPDASDDVIAAAIADLDSRHHAGISAGEFRYARETLGDAASREQYDKKLLIDLNAGPARQQRAYSYDYSSDEKAPWSARKTTFAVGVVAIVVLGYLALDFYRAKNDHEIQKAVVNVGSEQVGVQREAVQSSASIEQQRIQSENELRQRSMDIAEEQQRRQLELQAQAQERMREEQEARLKQQQQQQEEMRRQREQQYWACMNQQLDMRTVTSYDAAARCGRYH